MPGKTRATHAGGRPPVHLGVLGPTILSVDGAQVNAGGKGQRAVLIRLAVAEERLVTVDQLVEDLWGDDASESILSTLHGYVSRLRGVLGHSSRLSRMGPGYVLELATDEVDVRTFESMVDTGRRMLATDPTGASAVFGEALALWRGPALVDVNDRDWGVAAAVRLDALRLSAAEARFDALLASGRHESAVVELEQAVSDHPLRERFTAQLMIALYRSGRQTDALRQYERTRRMLADELGLDPSPDLVRHEAAILAHEPWLRAPDDRPIVVSPAAPSAAASTSPVPLPHAVARVVTRPFVGRDDTLATMRDVWNRALAGDRQFLVVEGEAGIGKTRVALRFAAEAHAAGAIVLFGRATSDSVVPYEPLVEAMRCLVRPMDEQTRTQVFAGRRGLQILLPFLGDGDDTAADPLADRYVMFESIADLVSTSSQSWPILLLVDDLQWGDQLSFRLLGYLFAHEMQSRLMVIGTIRTVPRVVNTDLDNLLSEVHRASDALSHIRLGGLREADVAQLLDLAGDTDAAARAPSVLKATRGNAFFVSEIAEHPVDGTLPASVRDVLGVRLSRLTDATTRFVRAAAIAGGVVPMSVLQAAAGLDPDEAVDALEEVLAAGLLVEEGSTAVTFRHGIVQQLVIEGIVLARRRAIHSRLADAYSDIKGAAMRHAYHLFEAGADATPGHLVDAAVNAGREALGVFAYEDAVGWAKRALGVADAAPEGLCAAYLLLSDANRALGSRLEAHAAARRAADIACDLSDPMWLAAAAEAVALVRAGVGFDFGVDDEGLDALLSEALQRLPAGDVEQRSRLLEASLSNAAANSDLYALRGLSVDALTLAGEHGHHALVATAHLAARMSVWRVDLLDERLRSDFAAQQAAEQSGRVQLQLNALLYLVSDLEEAGRVDEAEHWFGVVRELARGVRQPVYDAFVDFFDARRALLQGKYDEMSHLADRALTRGLQSHGINAEQAWAGLMFVRAWDLGQLPSLVDIVERSSNSAPHLPIWRIAHAACALATGDTELPRQVLDELILDGRLEHRGDSLWYAAAGLLAELARALDSAPHANVLVEALRPFTNRWALTGLGRVNLGPVDRYLGIAAMTSDDLDLAAEALQRAEQLARERGAWPHVARALVDRAALLRRRANDGDEAMAAGLEAEAAALAEPLGLVLGSLVSGLKQH